MNKQEVFAAVLSKYKDEEFSHLENMSITELCEYRQTISNQIKSLEDERKTIDTEIIDYLSEADSPWRDHH